VKPLFAIPLFVAATDRGARASRCIARSGIALGRARARPQYVRSQNLERQDAKSAKVAKEELLLGAFNTRDRSRRTRRNSQATHDRAGGTHPNLFLGDLGELGILAFQILGANVMGASSAMPARYAAERDARARYPSASGRA